MLTVSLKKLRFRVSMTMAAAALTLTVCLVLTASSPAVTFADEVGSITAYIAEAGWTVEPDSCEHTVYTVPDSFDDVMTAYNGLQLSQGFDLSRYCGKVVEKYSFTVTDYPGYEDTDFIRANVFVYGGEVIAGDVCSVRLDGFMEGLKRTNGKAPA